MDERWKQGLPPIARPDARLLILGSLPGDASLRAERYYAHPRNHFWLLLERVLGEPLVDLAYDQRFQLLQLRRVALWDVVDKAQRRGSLDGQMRGVEVRDLVGFVESLPELQAVAFNGATAARHGRKALGATQLQRIDLPSSSPALTMPASAKAERWMALRPFLID